MRDRLGHLSPSLVIGLTVTGLALLAVVATRSIGLATRPRISPQL